MESYILISFCQEQVDHHANSIRSKWANKGTRSIYFVFIQMFKINSQLKKYIFLICVLLAACAEKQTAQDELVLQPGYTQIGDIISIADCSSPFGDYTTEVRSNGNGSCYFVQRFEKDEPPFTVRLDTNNYGTLINDQDEVIDSLNRLDVEMIRGHEIHKMSVDPGFYFKNLRYDQQIDHIDIEHASFLGKDGLDNPVKLLYNGHRRRISKIELLNPRDTSQTIEIFYDAWIEGEYGDMAKAIKIVQAEKDTFYFDFISLSVWNKNGKEYPYLP